MALCAALGALLGALAFRYSVSGVYFTLLTIAFAEFTRIGFDHFTWLGGSGGLFLKVAQRDRIDLFNLRGTPAMFYYVILALAAAALVLSAWIIAPPAGLLLAGDSRKRGGGAGARHQHISLENAGDDHQRRQ